MENAIQLIFYLVIVIFSVVIHETSHGFAALWLGDHTAEYEGRLTLNPLKHLDPFGSIVLPFILSILHLPIIGWAKPVPYNPYNLRNQQWGPAMVGVAGPLSNILLAVVFGLALRFSPALQGSVSGAFMFNFMTIATMIAFLNLALAFFNLIPIPPLDGSKVLFAILPYQWIGIRNFLESYGLVLFLIFIFFFAGLLTWPVVYTFRLITGMFPVL